MTDMTLIDHERRLTTIEQQLTMAIPALQRQVAELLALGEQAKSDKAQAERREMGDLRARLHKAQEELAASATKSADDAEPGAAASGG